MFVSLSKSHAISIMVYRMLIIGHNAVMHLIYCTYRD